MVVVGAMDGVLNQAKGVDQGEDQAEGGDDSPDRAGLEGAEKDEEFGDEGAEAGKAEGR